MTQELLYTSAPRGLKPGSSGFCTVVCTQGMAANVALRLESLSGYRHVYQPQDSNAHRNPVVYSHLLLSVGRQPYHVLSRIAAAGVDYTQRTNKIAHHLVLEPGETPPAGPAWTLLPQQGLMETRWDGQARVLPAGRKVPRVDDAPAVCRAWQALAGDAGWGGVLAETALATPARQAAIIFRAGQDLLPLIAESLALLPADVRWRTTFSTYFTKLPVGVDCQWRCLLEGTPELTALRRAPQLLVLDLRAPLGAPPEGPWTDAARKGVVPRIARPRKSAIVPNAVRAGDEELEAELANSGADSSATQRGDATPYRVRGTPPPLGMLGIRGLPSLSEAKLAHRRRRRRITLFFGIAVTLLVIGLASWAAYKWFVPNLPAGTETKKHDTPKENKTEPPADKTPPGSTIVDQKQSAESKQKEKSKKEPPKEPPPVVPADLKYKVEKELPRLSQEAAEARKSAVSNANARDAAVGEKESQAAIRAAEEAANKAKAAADRASQIAVELTSKLAELQKDAALESEAKSLAESCNRLDRLVQTESRLAENAAALALLPAEIHFPATDLDIATRAGSPGDLSPKLAAGDYTFLLDRKTTNCELRCNVPLKDGAKPPYCEFDESLKRYVIGVDNGGSKCELASLRLETREAILEWRKAGFDVAKQASYFPNRIQHGVLAITYSRSESPEVKITRRIRLRKVAQCGPVEFLKDRVILKPVAPSNKAELELPTPKNMVFAVRKVYSLPAARGMPRAPATPHMPDLPSAAGKTLWSAPSEKQLWKIEANKLELLPGTEANAQQGLAFGLNNGVLQMQVWVRRVAKQEKETRDAVNEGLAAWSSFLSFVPPPNPFRERPPSTLPSGENLSIGYVEEACKKFQKMKNTVTDARFRSDIDPPGLNRQKLLHQLQNALDALGDIEAKYDSAPEKVAVEGELRLKLGDEELPIAIYRASSK